MTERDEIAREAYARIIAPELWGNPFAYPEYVHNDETLKQWRAVALGKASAILAKQAEVRDEGVASHEVDETGKPVDDSDPWFQLGWYKTRLAFWEAECAVWKERAMALKLATPKPATPAVEALRSAALSLVKRKSNWGAEGAFKSGVSAMYAAALAALTPADAGSGGGIRGEGWTADCPKCVGSKFTCDEHFVPAAGGEGK